MACSVTHNVKLPRRRRPASYSDQFVTLNDIFGMRCRRSALNLLGMSDAAAWSLRGRRCYRAAGIHAPTPFTSAARIIAGVETMHMIKKGQLRCPEGQCLSAAELFYGLAF